jgi:hypothetical protein
MKERIMLEHTFGEEITPQKSLFMFSMWRARLRET